MGAAALEDDGVIHDASDILTERCTGTAPGAGRRLRPMFPARSAYGKTGALVLARHHGRNRFAQCLESLEPGTTLKVGAFAGPLGNDGIHLSQSYDGERGRHGGCPTVPIHGVRCLPFAPTHGGTGGTDASD